MISYASRTGTRTTLTALRAAGWRLLVSATGSHRCEGFQYAIDNGAWTAFQKGRPFDHAAFRTLLAKHGAGADWIVLPDVVADRVATLVQARAYLEEFPVGYRWLLPVQDGMTEADVEPFLGRIYGLAIGGLTPWKLSSAPAWGRLALKHGLYLHMLRVNSAKRINVAAAAGCHSVDGTSAIKFPSTLRLLDFSIRQQSLVIA